MKYRSRVNLNVLLQILILLNFLRMAATRTTRLLEVKVIGDDDRGKENHYGYVVDADENSGEHPERSQGQQRTEASDHESDEGRDGGEEHTESGAPVAVGQTMGQRWVDDEGGRFPGLKEDEYVIGSQSENDKNGDEMEVSDVDVVEDNPVDEIRYPEARDDAKHGPSGHPKRSKQR